METRQLAALGIGTYAGAATPEIDARYLDVLGWTFERGRAFVDSSIAYRGGRSLACVAKALSAAKHPVDLCIKVGFGSTRAAGEAAHHSLDRFFLQDQVLRSVEALGTRPHWLLLHNPEIQLRCLERLQVENLLQLAFELLERFKQDGVIGGYGVATSRGFRVPPDDPTHLDLNRLLNLAAEVSPSHGFRAIQAPLSIDAPEALSVFQNAKARGLFTMGSSPLAPFQSHERPIHPRVALVAMRWALSVSSADWIVCGTLNLSHLKANFAAAAEMVTGDHWHPTGAVG